MTNLQKSYRNNIHEANQITDAIIEKDYRENEELLEAFIDEDRFLSEDDSIEDDAVWMIQKGP